VEQATDAAKGKITGLADSHAGAVEGGNAARAFAAIAGKPKADRRSINFLVIFITHFQNAGSILVLDVEWPDQWLSAFSPVIGCLSFRLFAIGSFDSSTAEAKIAAVSSLLLPVWMFLFRHHVCGFRKTNSHWDLLLGEGTQVPLETGEKRQDGGACAANSSACRIWLWVPWPGTRTLTSKNSRAAAAWYLARMCALPPSFYLPVRSCLRGAG
jgi:hypothetical protein